MTRNSTRRMTVLLIGSALALTYLIGGQTKSATDRVTNASVTPHSVVAPGHESAELPLLESLQETVDRPLFSPTRRAPKETRVVSAQSGIERGNYDLVGVILTADRRFALIQSGEADRTLRVTVGQRLDRWRVTRIEARSVVLSQRGETQELQLTDKERPRPAGVIQTEAVAAGQAPLPQTRAKAKADAAEPVS